MPDNSVFERGEVLYPQPIAYGCRNIRRALGRPALVDTILKTAEAVTRYAASLAIASYAARETTDASVPDAFRQFKGNLSFGHFLAVAKAAAATEVDHPLRDRLRQGFHGKYPKGALAKHGLDNLLKLRNQQGHELAHMSEIKAQLILAEHKPDELLRDALLGLEPILKLPLFLVDQQRFAKHVFHIRRLLLMGEALEPVPDEITVVSGLSDEGTLYLGLDDGALCLAPLLRWELPPGRDSYSLFLLHSIDIEEEAEKPGNIRYNGVKYKSVRGEDLVLNGPTARETHRRLTGGLSSLEPVVLTSGLSFVQEWDQRRQTLLQTTTPEIPWSELDREAIAWYAGRLGARGDVESQRDAIVHHLLDERTHLPPDDLRQLRLLLGRKEDIKRLLGRDHLLDLQFLASETRRWDERVQVTENIVESLRISVDFLSRHAHFETRELDRLQTEGGSVDYIAMREALINLFAHQDYQDKRAAAQIRVTPERVIFFNPGKSLVDEVALEEGHRSLSRNPLLSRALKLIGFAEMGGSGLVQVKRAYRMAHRRPPRIVSNAEANTFELTLELQAAPLPVDAFWQQRLGVSLTPLHAQVLVMLTDGPLDVSELADRLAVPQSEVEASCQALTKEVLIEVVGERFRLAERLQALAEEARGKGL